MGSYVAKLQVFAEGSKVSWINLGRLLPPNNFERNIVRGRAALFNLPLSVLLSAPALDKSKGA